VHFKRGRLLHHNLDTPLVLCAVFLSPPVDHIALGIVLAPLIIKAMRHFVSYYCSHRSVINGIVRVLVEEWWFCTCGGNNTMMETRPKM
jgi:hypothetical protein